MKTKADFATKFCIKSCDKDLLRKGMVVFMRSKRYQKEHKNYMAKLLVAVAVVVVVAVCSIVGVMAKTIPCKVIDGSETYEFSLMSPDKDAIIEKALEDGMAPLEADDTSELKATTLTVKRVVGAVLQDDDGFIDLVAYKGETVANILTNNEVQFADSDTVTPERDFVVNESTTISVSREKTIFINVDGGTKKYVTEAATVAEVLNEFGITLGDKDEVSEGLDAQLENSMNIVIWRNRIINVTESGTTTSYDVYATNVRRALKEAGITLGDDDVVEPGLATKLGETTDISISRVEYKTETKTEAIAFETEEKYTDDLYEGDQQVKTEGKEGEKEVTYKDKYVDGELVKSKVKSEKVTLEPVNKIVLIGTKQKSISESAGSATEPPTQGSTSGNTFTDMYGNEIAYKNVMTGQCTAYSDPGGITSLGLATQVGIVAVDPNVIPYGTKMYITSGNIVYGYAIAGDTGGAAMAGDILVDVYYDTEGECVNFGRRDMTVYIIS